MTFWRFSPSKIAIPWNFLSQRFQILFWINLIYVWPSFFRFGTETVIIKIKIFDNLWILRVSILTVWNTGTSRAFRSFGTCASIRAASWGEWNNWWITDFIWEFYRSLSRPVWSGLFWRLTTITATLYTLSIDIFSQ